MPQDPRDKGKSLRIVDQRGTPMQAAVCRPWGTHAGHTTPPLDGGDQCRFLATDEGTRPFRDA